MNIVNAFDQSCAAGGDRIVIWYFPNEYGRITRPARFSVARYRDGKEIIVEKGAHWQDRGHKTFHVDWSEGKRRDGTFHQRKQAALVEALAWVKKTYGKDDFVRNRMGDYVEREVNERFPIPKRERTSQEKP